MAYVQAKCFLSAPHQTPKDELFQQATSFQDSLEAELKNTLCHCRHQRRFSGHLNYRAELQTLLLTVDVLRGAARHRRSELSEGTETSGTCAHS